jgi:hypothetical protein
MMPGAAVSGACERRKAILEASCVAWSKRLSALALALDCRIAPCSFDTRLFGQYP